MIVLGLTGSMAMGKSTTAGFFQSEGVPVHDADAVVHDLYRGEAVDPVGAAFPGTAVDGAIDRARLRAAVTGNAAAIKRLEAIVHPLVRDREQRFLDRMRRSGARVAVLDVPLLLESTETARCDMIVVVTAPEPIQRERLLARPGMSEETLRTLLARQMPDAEKRRRAHFLVDTGHGLESARRQVQAILRATAASG